MFQNTLMILQKYGMNFVNGLGVTLYLAFISVALGCVIGAVVAICGAFVYKYKPIAGVMIYHRSGRVDHKRGTADDKQVGVSYGVNRTAHHTVIKTFAVQHDVGLDNSAAFALRNTVGV